MVADTPEDHASITAHELRAIRAGPSRCCQRDRNSVAADRT